MLHNCRLVILASAQTCLICPDRVTGETKAFASQCKLRKGHDGIRNYDAHIIEAFCSSAYSFALRRHCRFLTDLSNGVPALGIR